MVSSPFRSSLLFVALLAACIGSGPAAAVDAAPPRDPYRINPGDVLQITVWKEEDLQRELLVNPDGHVAFPLAGDLVAGGTGSRCARKSPKS